MLFEPPKPNIPFAIKSFKNSDLNTFASLSSDKNPLHMDPLIARRAQEGTRVVHGIYLLLYGLDRLAKAGKMKSRIYRIKCDFKNPVLLDEQVDYFFQEQKEGSVKLKALVENIICAEIELWSLKRDEKQKVTLKIISDQYNYLKKPLELDEKDLLNFSATISNPRNPRIKSVFPALCKAIHPSNVSALARLSYIVGMVCPGFYSKFFSLDVALCYENPRGGYTTFVVTEFNGLFNLLEMKLEGDLSGTLKALRRPRPFQQPTVESVKGFVVPGEFEKSKALIIGGSRGLGELTAKLICAGGGVVFLGYHKGKDEAEKIADEIKKSALGVCYPVEVDIHSTNNPKFTEVLDAINCLYYYPTPAIFKKRSKLFHKRNFEEFIDFYVERFIEICEIIENRSAKKIQIYYPSTSFIDKRPNDMTTYTMAKSAAEILIQDINRNFRKINILCSRLPRMGTDQTNSIIEVKKEDSLATLLPIVRAVQNQVRD